MADDQIQKPWPGLGRLSAGLARRQFDNGLVCLIKEDWSAPLVALQVWVGSGSAQEEEYLGGGLSHLLEHMIFKGTPRRQPADIARQIGDAGGEINAYTSLDRTVFLADLPAEQWQTGLDILADAVLNASFPEDEWRREKEVVRREMAMNNDDPGHILSKILWQTTFLVHPYRFPVIGRDEIFAGLARNDLLAFFRRHYTPDNMIVAVVGAVSAPQVEAAIRQKFAPALRARRAPVLPPEPPQLAPRFARQTGAYNVSRLAIAWHTVALSHPDAPALDLLAAIVGSGKSARLEQQIKENLKLAFNIEAWSFTPREAGLFGISATFDPAKEAELIKAVEAEVAEWRGGALGGDSENAAAPAQVSPEATPRRAALAPPRSSDSGKGRDGSPSRPNSEDRMPRRGIPTLFSPAEIEKARNKITADTLLALQTMHGQAETFASGEFYAGAPDYFRVYLTRLVEVTPQALSRVADKYLTDNNRTLAVLAPQPANSAAGKAPEIPPEIKVSKRVLANGLTLLCREDRRLPFVHVCVATLGGLLLENEKNNGITCLMAELLTRGTAQRSQAQTAAAVENLGAALGAFSGLNSYGLQGQCFARDADTFLEILADCYTRPVFPAEEISKGQGLQAARVDQQHEAPMFLAQEALRRALFPGHPYSLNVEGSRASILAINRAEILRLHAATAVSSNTALAVFGDISAEEASALAEKYFAHLPAGPRQEWKKVGREPPAPPDKDKNGGAWTHTPYLEKKIELTAPREQTILLCGFPGLAVSDQRLDALNILLEALNGLSSDLMIKVRDTKGLAYYTGAYHRPGLAGGQLVVYAGTRAAQAEQVGRLIADEIRRLGGQGLRAEEFERAKKQIISAQRQSLQANGQLAIECALNELYGLGYAYALEKEKRLEKLSPADARNTAADLMRREAEINVIVRPAKENAAGGSISGKAEGRRQNEE